MAALIAAIRDRPLGRDGAGGHTNCCPAPSDRFAPSPGVQYALMHAVLSSRGTCSRRPDTARAQSWRLGSPISQRKASDTALDGRPATRSPSDRVHQAAWEPMPARATACTR